jgi:hypothetical protein
MYIRWLGYEVLSTQQVVGEDSEDHAASQLKAILSVGVEIEKEGFKISII